MINYCNFEIIASPISDVETSFVPFDNISKDKKEVSTSQMGDAIISKLQ